MIVKGFSFKPRDAAKYHPVWRFYGTKEVFQYPDGRVKPQPGSWELVCEVKVEMKRGKVTLPDFELELTQPGGWRFYNPVLVADDGQEKWQSDEELIFPREMLAEFDEDEINIGTLILYNMELRGEIAPGQLHD